MIISQLRGGLGNQLFQYAFGRRLAHDNGMQFKLDAISGFKNDPYKRKYSLSFFNIQSEFAKLGEIPFGMRTSKIFRRLELLFQSVIPLKMRSIVFEKDPFVFDPKILDVKKPTYFSGYWQSEKYFKPIENIIRQEFTLNYDPTSKFGSMEKLLNNPSSVSIHIRRLHGVADGKPIPSHVKLYGSSPMEYYEKAIDFINSRINNPNYLVFSDDPDWCKENFKFKSPTIFVSDVGVTSDVEELYLMSLCKNHIISNSTFGWWGAWLGNNPEKIVIAPSQWMKTDRYLTTDLIPQDWIII